MATASCLLSEDKFLCSVCLDVFNQPVSTPCGHNFCSACINKYWDSSDICQCPLCQRTFSTRPELHVNTIIAELAAEFKKAPQVKASTPDPQPPEREAVHCDICSDMKEKAIKSCLTCQTSFCDVHLEPHRRVAALKTHTLIDPVRNLDERICKEHHKMTELYCRTDQACICVLCLRNDHKGHDVVTNEEEYELMMTKKDVTIANIQEMIKSRSEKMNEVECSVKNIQVEAKKAKANSEQVFSDFICSIQKSKTEVDEVIEERQRAATEEATCLLKELKAQITELENQSIQLEQLSQSDDHHSFVQKFPTLCSPSIEDWIDVGVCSDLSFEAVTGALSLLQQRADEVMEEIPEIKLKRLREHAVDLTLDPDTANRTLAISQDGKQVERLDTKQNVPDNPKRFDCHPEVLTKEGFTTGKFYYEVQVEGTEWTLGVVRESVERKDKTGVSVDEGFWTLRLKEGRYLGNKWDEINVKQKLEKLGIFVDYDKGEVSFYNVDTKSLLYSFTGQHFNEKMYPFFYIWGKRPDHLIITPVPQTH